MKQRTSFIEEQSALEIHINMYKKWFNIIFNGIVFLILVSGVPEMPQMLKMSFKEFSGPGIMPFIFPIVCIWGFGYWVYILFWNAFGREIIIITPETLVLKNDIFGLGLTKKYNLDGISNLRTEKVKKRFNDSKMAFGFGYGTVVFDYRKKVQRFGIQLGIEEAQMIIDKIRLIEGIRLN